MNRAEIIIEKGRARITTPIDKNVNISISDILSYKIDDAIFIKQQYTNWCCYKKLYDIESQSFPVGLIDRLKTFGLKHLDIEFSLINNHIIPVKQHSHPDIHEFSLYGFQEEPVDVVIRHLTSSPTGRGILVIPTGGGKTVMAGFIINRLNRPALFVVRNRILLYQAIESFRKMFGDNAVGQLGDGVVDVKPILVATLQTLCAITGLTYTKTKEGDDIYDEVKKEKKIKRQEDIKKAVLALDNYQLLIIDEVHGVTSTTAYAFVEYMQASVQYILGLTATPNKDSSDKMLLEAAMGGIIYRISPDYLMEIGYLSPFIARFNIMQLHPQRPYSVSQYDLAFKELIAENAHVNDYIVNLAKQRISQHRKVFVATRFIEQSMKLADQIPKSVFIYGKTSKDMRDEAIRSFKNDDIRCIVATIKLMGEGVDIRCISSIINASAMKSTTATIQLIGRGLRTDNNKVNLIYDDMVHEGVGFFERAADQRIRTVKNEYGEDKLKVIR